ncbi:MULTISPECIES: hypothetical protein [Nonomuraea]|jgi:hypothetical protein|uniref:YtxH domain-containing protein n=2 Tax=Nonomuraea TaxID=83681 RepID=A0ABW1C024_9ACTN|nr:MULTISPECIES: hypothetical protein [Nonomuraea]MDA0646022.1 hypothetical protein [Nonomuraea ferruginea]TXK40391.1 hypothetical protein FR742_12995 [Nonomuraea sp. C10]
MIRRLFYLSLGAFLSLWVMRKLQALHPNHVARRTAHGAAGMLEQVRDFTSDALGEAAGREIELRARFGLDNPEHND